MKLIYLKPALKCDSFDIAIGIKIPFFRVLVTIEPGRSLLQFVTTNCLIPGWFLPRMVNRGIALDVLRIFLSNRYQFVEINCLKSGQRLFNCGFPEGYDIDPNLFSLFISDMPNCIPNCCFSDSDMTKSFRN